MSWTGTKTPVDFFSLLPILIVRKETASRPARSVPVRALKKKKKRIDQTRPGPERTRTSLSTGKGVSLAISKLETGGVGRGVRPEYWLGLEVEWRYQVDKTARFEFIQLIAFL